MATFELKCQKCGGELKESGWLFECEYCHAKYESDSVEKEKAALASLLDEQKQEQVANHRHMLWDAIHAEYIDSESIVEISRSLRRLLPEDFSARFFELANSATPRQINGFLRTVDLTDPMQAFWAEEIVKFMIRSLQAENLLAVQSFIERAYKNVDLEKYEKYSTIFSTEAKRVKGGVYEPNEPRDVFVMYSSWDIKFVEELVEYLEEKGITCFVALRNLQHGRGAVENYQRSIEKAMKACRTVVFVSSKHSRSFSCDATRIELPYLLENGKNKPRVEYCLDSESGGSGLVKEYFAGLERVYSKEEAGKRIEKGLASLVLKKEEKKETQEKICLACGAKNPQKAKFCLECGGHEFAANEQEKFDREKAAREEAERKNKALLEELNRLKEEKAAAEKAAAEKAEAEKKRLEEQEAKKQAEKENKAPMVETNGKDSSKNQTEADEICKKAQAHYEKKEYAQAKALFEQAANLGSAEGQVGLGWCYYYGNGVTQNRQKAEELFTLAAKQGNAEAQFGIGNCYHNKAAFEKDEAKKKAIYLTAFAWYENAALQGYAKAESQVAAYYQCGFGVERDYNKYHEWLEKGVKNGDIRAQYDLAQWLEAGMYGYKKDLEQAFEWYQKIAAQKSTYGGLACLCLGRFYENGIYVQKDLKQAYEYYSKAFAEGVSYAGVKIGTFYENGIYPKQDLRKAFEWYHKAATEKYPSDNAITNLARCYENGIGVEKNLQKALEWYQKLPDYVIQKKEHIARVQAAIEQSKKAEQAPVPQTPVPKTPTEKTPADLYLEGKVLYDRRDYKRSFPLFLQAAEKGHSTAQYWVGHSYSQGLGVTQNYFKAFEWYQKAANQENAQAQYCLGHAYHFGNGVAKDKQKAVEWFSKAVKNGDNYSRAYLREYGLCQHCGGELKGLFNKVCTACGKKKDY